MRILVVEARGLHIGYLGCYGNEWIATPNLDRLAAEGVVFDRHYHDCPHLPGPAAPGCIGPEKGTGPLEFRGPVPFSGLEEFGQRALDAWQSDSAAVAWIAGPNLTAPWELPEDLRAVYFDEANEGEPWLDPPTDVVLSLTIPEQMELQNTYAAAVTWFDAQFGFILDALRASGELEATVVCVTAGAGLPLGEHGEIGPARAWLHEQRVHVPLVMRFPQQQHEGLRIAALTQPPDLVATIAHLIPTHAIADAVGVNLLPLLLGEIDSVRPYACSRLQVGDSVEWALRTLDWAFLLPIQVPEGDAPRGPQLYIKPDDRWEVNDVHQQHLELVEEFEHTLRAMLEKN